MSATIIALPCAASCPVRFTHEAKAALVALGTFATGVGAGKALRQAGV